MISALKLKEIAEKKLAEDQEHMEIWAEDTADAAAEWCQVDAGRGKFSATIESRDICCILPSSVPKEAVYMVLFNAKQILEKHGYSVTIDNDIPKETVKSISICWGANAESGMEISK